MAADVNGDGKPDIVVTEGSATRVLLNQGGTFAPGALYLDGRFSGPLVVADLNGDGRPDLATASSFLASPGFVYVLTQACLP